MEVMKGNFPGISIRVLDRVGYVRHYYYNSSVTVPGWPLPLRHTTSQIL